MSCPTCHDPSASPGDGHACTPAAAATPSTAIPTAMIPTSTVPGAAPGEQRSRALGTLAQRAVPADLRTWRRVFWVAVAGSLFYFAMSLTRLVYGIWEQSRVTAIFHNPPPDALSQLDHIDSNEKWVNQMLLLSLVIFVLLVLLYSLRTTRLLAAEGIDPKPVVTHWGFRARGVIVLVNLVITLFLRTRTNTSTDPGAALATLRHNAHVIELASSLRMLSIAAMLIGVFAVGRRIRTLHAPAPHPLAAPASVAAGR